MKKKVLSILLVLCMMVGFLPTIAYADDPDISISEYAGNEVIGEYAGQDSEDAKGNGWSYDAATKTLVLNNFRGNVTVYCAKVVLIGENTVTFFQCFSPRYGQQLLPIVEGPGSLTTISGAHGDFVLDNQLQMIGGSLRGDTMPLKKDGWKVVKPDGMTASYIRIEPIGDAGPSTTGRYIDVPVSAWYYEAIEYVNKPVYDGYNYGLMDGITANEFSPNTNADRATIITALCRRFNFDIEGNSFYEKTFSDVPENLGAIVDWAVSNSIVNGYGDGTFGPYDPVTREQFATMLYRYVQYKGEWRDTSLRADLSAYSDSAQISSWAMEAMSWANASEYIKGKTSTTLDPQGNITRAEVATVLMRLY